MTTEIPKLSDLLNELALSLELAPPPPAEKKRPIHMELSPYHAIDFRELAKGFSMWSRIGECPAKNKEDFYLYAMRANFLGQGTGNYVLGIDPEEKHLTLSSHLPYEMDFKKFKETVEDFVNFVDYWKEALEGHTAQASGMFNT